MKQDPTISNLQSHFVRINKVLDHVEQNLDGDLSLAKLAPISCYSPYHFHRTFTAICGETPYEFVLRKRLEKIAWLMLKQKELPIMDFAYRYGFDNPTSFSRSFKKYYGISPRHLRIQSKSVYNKLSRQNSKIGKKQVSVEQYFRDKQTVIDWMQTHGQTEVKLLDSKRLAYIRNKGGFELSDQAFIQLRSWAGGRGLLDTADSNKWLLIVHDNPAFTEAPKVSHSACLVIPDYLNVKDQIATLEIPAGQFLVGNFELLPHEFSLAWESMSIRLMEWGCQLRDDYYFEIFRTDSIFQKNVKHPVELCLPVN